MADRSDAAESSRRRSRTVRPDRQLVGQRRRQAATWTQPSGSRDLSLPVSARFTSRSSTVPGPTGPMLSDAGPDAVVPWPETFHPGATAMRRLLDLWRWRLPGRKPRSPGARAGLASRPGHHRRVRQVSALRSAAGRSRRSGKRLVDRRPDPSQPASQQPDSVTSRRVPDPPAGPGSWPASGPSSWPASWPSTWPGPGTTPPLGGLTAAPPPRLMPGRPAAAGNSARARTQIKPTRTQTVAGGVAATQATTTASAASKAKGDARAKAAGQAKGAAQAKAVANAKSAIPWYERAKRTNSAPGQRHCGRLEKILHRQWAADQLPPPQLVLPLDPLPP